MDGAGAWFCLIPAPFQHIKPVILKLGAAAKPSCPLATAGVEENCEEWLRPLCAFTLQGLFIGELKTNLALNALKSKHLNTLSSAQVLCLLFREAKLKQFSMEM